VTAPIILPWPLQNSLEIAARLLLHAGDQASIDFLRPAGEAALAPADSVSWRVFKNPLALFVGGVTAVIMELAEPRVRAGVWEHTTFRSDPLRRLRRTGLAAMVTVYGAHSVAEPMIARVRRVHDMVAGSTLSGEPYRARQSTTLNACNPASDPRPKRQPSPLADGQHPSSESTDARFPGRSTTLPRMLVQVLRRSLAQGVGISDTEALNRASGPMEQGHLGARPAPSLPPAPAERDNR
jgi:hypothetical protein